jgi:hypothetical protein
MIIKGKGNKAMWGLPLDAEESYEIQLVPVKIQRRDLPIITYVHSF